jgi:DNA-binding NtrC family response regulator
MPACRKVLLFKSNDVDLISLRKALRAHARVTEVGTLSDLARLLGEGDYDALFCGWEIAGGTWQDALNEVQQRASELPVVVAARLGGEKQWVEVLGRGAFDMITAPYQMRTILYLLEHAAASKAARTLSPHFGALSKADSRGSTNILPASAG